MTKSSLLEGLRTVEKLANGSKLRRLLAHPIRYVKAIGHREISYRRKSQAVEVVSDTFFSKKMHLLLPASTDIYLTGGKSHSSEIRLARFLIHTLERDQTFFDVGAHYGYFSFLASQIVGEQGQVVSFEAAPATFAILQKNHVEQNVSIYNRAVSDEQGYLTFFEFPNMYSEYNSLDNHQYEDAEWYQDSKPNEVQIEAIRLDDLITGSGYRPSIIKVDVEGAEYQVVKGMRTYLQTASPILIMEYLSEERGNVNHVTTQKLLEDMGYCAHIIDTEGRLIPVKSMEAYFQKMNLDSDNVVFQR